MKLVTVAIMAMVLYMIPGSVRAVVLGQIDTFEDGTTQNWSAGAQHPAPPVNVPTGGPGGVDDNYLLVTAIGGDGSGSRLAVFNRSQWAGDYLAAGIDAVRMDLLNLGQTDLYIRLLFSDPQGGPPSNEAITSATFLPAGGGWTPVGFSIAPSDLIVLLGDASAALSHATDVRIFHSQDPYYPPPPVVAQLGVDNIEAYQQSTPIEGTSWSRIKSLYR